MEKVTFNDIFAALKKMKREDPETFFNGLGHSVPVMSSFVGGSYELGILAGVAYTLAQIYKEDD